MLKANWNKPLKEVIQTINEVIRGWVNYFRIGNSNSTFKKVNYIEKKVRKFVMRRKKLKGFGWKRWSREDIYQKWGLYNDYQIRYINRKRPQADRCISLNVKSTGKPYEGKPHVRFDEKALEIGYGWIL